MICSRKGACQMKDMNQLREEINEIDDKLLTLLEERFKVSKGIGEYKKSNSLQIFVKPREEEILQKVSEHTSHPTITRNIFASIMRQSRQIQYQGIVEEDTFRGLDFIYKNKVDHKNLKSLICLGPIGTNSHLAAKKFLTNENVSIEHANNFDEVCQQISYENGIYGVLPIENTTEGVVNQVYDLLVKHKLYILDEISLSVSNCLIGAADEVSQIKTIISHPQALAQCKNLISRLKVTTLECPSTAQAVAECVGKQEYAAIANEMCAEIYELNILMYDINDEKTNQTKFVLVSDKPHIGNDTKEFMLAFTLEHQSGSLSGALQLFSDYGLSMNSLVSRPVPDRPFEYRFYVTVTGDLNDSKVKALLLQLESELLSVQFLGNLI